MEPTVGAKHRTTAQSGNGCNGGPGFRKSCIRVTNFSGSDFKVVPPGAPDLWYIVGMNRSEALETLLRSEPDLRARGVRRAAVFGSVARGDSRPDSDVDIMVEIDPAAHLTVFEYAGLKQYTAGLFEGPVDVVNRDGLKPHVRPAATADAIYAF